MTATATGNSRVAVFPSAQLRPVPSFAFAIPDGWVLDESSTALAAVHPPEPVDGFWVNVLLNHERVPAALDLQQVASITLARLEKDTGDARVTEERLAHLGARETYLRLIEASTPEGREITQMHATFFGPRAPQAQTADLFQIIGTMPRSGVDEHGPRMVQIVGSFRFV